jgi:selenocysteine lyase/cysteine desulfurase
VPNWNAIRAQFPALSNLTYLNTAGGCALPTQAANAGRQYFDEMEINGDVCWPQWLERTESVRQQFADYISATPEEIAFVSNASLAMNFAQKYAPPGDVLLIDEDFPTVTLPWLAAERKTQFTKPESDGRVDLLQMEKSIKSSTSCIAVGHVNYSTGFCLDLGELSELCTRRGLFLVVDATQSLGAIPIDVSATSIDCLLMSGYKWSTAGYGIGVMYLKREHLQSNKLPAAGWRSAKIPYEMKYDSIDASDCAAALELGHPPFPGILALGGSLKLLSDVGQGEIFERIIFLSDYLHRKLEPIVGVSIISTAERKHRSGITMLEVSDPDAICSALKEKDVFISVRNGLLRVSTHFYNLESDIDKFVSELRTLL